MLLSERLQQLREKAGFENAKAFANAMGMPYSTYSTYESGKSEPKAAALVKIAAALQVSVDDLLGYHVDDFDKAAALFREATGKTAKRNGDKVQIEDDPVWTRPISEKAFLAVMQEANDDFNKMRPAFVQTSIRNGIDRFYQMEYGESPFKGTPLEEAEKYFSRKELHDYMNRLKLAKNETEQMNVTKEIAAEIQASKNFQKIFKNLKKAAAPAQDHATADNQAKEKGPHSKE